MSGLHALTRLDRQKRKPLLSRLPLSPPSSSSLPFGTRALRAGCPSQIVPAGVIPRQSSAMRFRRLSQTRRNTNPSNERALRSPERGMNRTMWRLDDREERRDQESPLSDWPAEDGRRSFSRLESGRLSFQYDVETGPEPQGLHIPGWEYSHNQHAHTPLRPSFSTGGPLVPYARSRSAMELPTGPSIPPTPEAWLRPPSTHSSRYSRPQSAVPLLCEPAHTITTRAASANNSVVPPQAVASAPQHIRTRSSPAALLCLTHHLSKIHRPRFPSLSNFAARKSKYASLEVATTKPLELTPLRIRTPKTGNKPRSRSGMREKPLANITNSGQRRMSSIDMAREAGREADEGWETAHGRFSYQDGPGPAVVDATMSSVDGSHGGAHVRAAGANGASLPPPPPPPPPPFMGRGRIIDVAKGRVKPNGNGKEKAWGGRTATTPWLDEGTVVFEPFGVVFD